MIAIALNKAVTIVSPMLIADNLQGPFFFLFVSVNGGVIVQWLWPKAEGAVFVAMFFF